ncbi:MAG TPA: hypothetical protein VEX38_10285, partial [Fimbriimonadaceae bacterium]|nr:hypothetical protein [Fimbriimonadaceae bacterium]
CRVDAVEGGVFRIRFAVQNTGWLPTNVSKVAANKKLVRGVVGEITCERLSCGGAGSSEPEWLIAGKLREEKGQLVGWSHVSVSGFGWQMNATDDVAVFEWVVKPGTYDLVARHERAGSVQHRLTV